MRLKPVWRQETMCLIEYIDGGDVMFTTVSCFKDGKCVAHCANIDGRFPSGKTFVEELAASGLYDKIKVYGGIVP